MYLTKLKRADRSHLCEMIDDMDDDSDYVILSGGINDYFRSNVDGIKIGEVSWGWTNDVDKSTMCGALEYIIRIAIEKFKKAKILYVITHKSSSTPLTVDWIPWEKGIISVLEKYGIPYIDMNDCTQLKITTDYVKNNYQSDNIHPNADGYKRFYVDPITSKLKNI